MGPFAQLFVLRRLTRKLFQQYNDMHQVGVRLFEWEGLNAVSVAVDRFCLESPAVIAVFDIYSTWCGPWTGSY